MVKRAYTALKSNYKFTGGRLDDTERTLWFCENAVSRSTAACPIKLSAVLPYIDLLVGKASGEDAHAARAARHEISGILRALDVGVGLHAYPNVGTTDRGCAMRCLNNGECTTNYGQGRKCIAADTVQRLHAFSPRILAEANRNTCPPDWAADRRKVSMRASTQGGWDDHTRFVMVVRCATPPVPCCAPVPRFVTCAAMHLPLFSFSPTRPRLHLATRWRVCATAWSSMLTSINSTSLGESWGESWGESSCSLLSR